MLRHPAVVAAVLLSVSILVSALIVSSSLHALRATLESKLDGHVSVDDLPRNLGVNVYSSEDSPIRVQVQNRLSNRKPVPFAIEVHPTPTPWQPP